MHYPSRVSYPLACAFGYTLLLPQVFVRSGYYSAGLKDQRQMRSLHRSCRSLSGAAQCSSVW